MVRVLIVDDEEPIRVLLKYVFKVFRPDYEVMTVIDAPAALTQLEQQLMDVAIVDYQLPGMNGIELAYTLRQRWPALRVILISGNPPVDVKHHLGQLRLAGYLKKPFSPQQLIEVVDGADTFL